MPHDDYTSRERAVRIRLDATASRPPGRCQGWTVQAGYWHAAAPTEKAAADALAAGLHEFLTQYEPARLLTFRGYTAIVELDLGAEDGSLEWHRRTVTPDGRVCLTSFRAATWAEAEADTRRSLAQQSTDWHDDASVHATAAFLDRGPRGEDRSGPDDLYHYAAWQRAAKAATDNGRLDWHEWASAHQQEFTIPRPTE